MEASNCDYIYSINLSECTLAMQDKQNEAPHAYIDKKNFW